MAKKAKPDKRALRTDKAPKRSLQVGALCYRWTPKGKLRILLITSRRTKRWISPKGWPMRKKSHAEAAAQEAFEEAGAIGRIAPVSIGFYRYRKSLGGRKSTVCTVQVFPMEVTAMRKEFREKGQRTLTWMKPKKAIERADPREFAQLIRYFAKSAVPPDRSVPKTPS